jgi:hypothetical protein
MLVSDDVTAPALLTIDDDDDGAATSGSRVANHWAVDQPSSPATTVGVDIYSRFS